MRAVIQRVNSARVEVENAVSGSIGNGLLVYIGISHHDTDKDIDYIVDKIIQLRIFSDDNGRMNLSVLDKGYSILAVSQFTLYGDARKGRRPSYHQAAEGVFAREMYDKVIDCLRKTGVIVATGVFQAQMQVFSRNDGPVTILLDGTKAF